MSNTNVLKNSLKQLYQDSPEILNMLEQIDYSQIQGVWETQLYARISKQEVKQVESLLTSDRVQAYHTATQQAVLACTRELSNLLEFVLIENRGELN